MPSTIQLRIKFHNGTYDTKFAIESKKGFIFFYWFNMSANGYKLVNVAIKSQSTTTYSVSLDCIVLLKITVDIPNLPLDFSNWKTPHCIQRVETTLNTT